MRKLTFGRFLNKIHKGNGFVKGYPKGEEIAFIKKRVFEADNSVNAMQIYIDKTSGHTKKKYQHKKGEWKLDLDYWLKVLKTSVSKSEFKSVKSKLSNA